MEGAGTRSERSEEKLEYWRTWLWEKERRWIVGGGRRGRVGRRGSGRGIGGWWFVGTESITVRPCGALDWRC